MFSKYHNSEAALIEMAAYFSPKISQENLTNEIKKHPQYPHLLAISDVLNYYNISTGAYHVDVEDLNDAPLPFIAHTNLNNGEFIIITELNDEQLIYSDHNRKHQKISFDAFKEIYTGTVLIAENATKALPRFHFIHSRNVRTYLTYKNILATIVLALSLLAIFAMNANGTFYLTIGIKTLGLIISGLLLIQNIDKNNPFTKSICSLGGRLNCNAILSSKAAMVWPGLSWSEVGFYYFASTWAMLLFNSANIIILQTVILLNIICLPYTFYSLYYQAVIARQWCLFCCIIQGVLWLEFISLIPNLNLAELNQIDGISILNILLCITIPVLGWLFLKPNFGKAIQLNPLKEQLRVFKYNSSFFRTLLKQQPKFSIPEESWSIVLGNVEAENIITVVSNPYCQPCSIAHAIIEKVLNFNQNIQIRIVFALSDPETESLSPIKQHLMALNKIAGKDIVKQALHDWYERKYSDFNSWAVHYPVQPENYDISILKHQLSWCIAAEIKSTPTFLVNGHVLPEMYHINDIKYLLG